MQVQGKIIAISATQQVSDKFKKREFVIAIEEQINGNTYTNYGKFQCTQAKCDILDRFKIGDVVSVSYNIKGNSYVKDGETKYMTNLDAWKIDASNAAATVPPQAGQYASAPTAQPQAYSAPAQMLPESQDLPF